MRIALISDIHGNDVALDAVLADIDRAGVDKLYCLGDVATLGPSPGAVIERLRERQCSVVQGNHDAFLLQPNLVASYTNTPAVVSAIDWCRERLTPDALAFLETFSFTIDVPLDEGQRMLLFHGTPRSFTENLLVTTPPEELDRMLGGSTALVFAGGHTHVQMLRQHHGRLVVNVGSVGMPFREFAGGRAPALLAHAEYGIVTAENGLLHVDLRRVLFDRERYIRTVQSSGCPLASYLLDAYKA